MPTWWDRLAGGMRWGKNATLDEPSSVNADNGFAFLGQTPPSTGLHDALFQYKDDADYWLYQQIKAECDGQGISLSYNTYNSLKAAIDKRVAALNTAITNETSARSGADSTLSTNLTAEIANRQAGDAALDNAKENKLGFVPVRQGGGAFQDSGITVQLGWDGTEIRAQAGTNDRGKIWTDGRKASLFNGTGYEKLPDGFLFQFAQGSASAILQDFNFPIPFPNGVASVVLCENAGQGSWTIGVPTLYALNRGGVTQTKYQVCSMTWNAGAKAWEGPPGGGNLAFNMIALGW